jgi:hypothetical protein
MSKFILFSNTIIPVDRIIYVVNYDDLLKIDMYIMGINDQNLMLIENFDDVETTVERFEDLLDMMNK